MQSATALCAGMIVGLLTSFPAKGQDGVDPATGSLPQQTSPDTRVEDVIVEGQRVSELSRSFVSTIAPPIEGRGLARWPGSVCVGVGNLQAQAAQQMADRISDWAHSEGLTIAEPGCEPNIVVVFTNDGSATAKDMVRARPREFRTGMTKADRGADALRSFQESDAPIRWWHVSLTVDDETGNPVGRLPGQAPVEWIGRRLTRPWHFGVNSMNVTGSRLTGQVRDDLQQAIVVVDMKALDYATFAQVTDYVALVALAHIDAEADTLSFPSILNLFDPASVSEPTLTAWDKAFLSGLYGAEQNRRLSRANVSQVAEGMVAALAGQSETASPPD